MRKTAERVSVPYWYAGIFARTRWAEIASASEESTRGNETTSASGEVFATIRVLFAAKVSTPRNTKSVQSLHWWWDGWDASLTARCVSLQQVSASPQAFSISTLPSLHRHRTIPSTPANADARKTRSVNRYIVQAFTRTIIA